MFKGVFFYFSKMIFTSESTFSFYRIYQIKKKVLWPKHLSFSLHLTAAGIWNISYLLFFLFLILHIALQNKKKPTCLLSVSQEDQSGGCSFHIPCAGGLISFVYFFSLEGHFSVAVIKNACLLDLFHLLRAHCTCKLLLLSTQWN